MNFHFSIWVFLLESLLVCFVLSVFKETAILEASSAPTFLRCARKSGHHLLADKQLNNCSEIHKLN